MLKENTEWSTIMSNQSKSFQYKIGIKHHDTLRASFNALTSRTFGFDFEDWYRSGHWGKWYIPHVLLDGDEVISNVSVNLMQFDLNGTTKNYIQLGTVMTDEAHRGQGLNRQIMEHVLEEYAGKVDGIYLFGNDEVVNYYPKFGFRPAKEYEYYLDRAAILAIKAKGTVPYLLQSVDLDDEAQAEALYSFIRDYSIAPSVPNQNDGLYMSENISLFQFWLAAGFGNQVYYLPETGNYVMAGMDGEVLRIHQIFGKQTVDIYRLTAAFGASVEEVILEYTPAKKEGLLVREHIEEDSTLFILGDDLECIEREKMMFPVLSHA